MVYGVVVDLSGFSDVELAELAVRVGALRSPALLASWLDPGYRVCAHHRLIGEELAGLLESGGGRRLMVFAPPRSGKSELVTKWFPLWCFLRRPGVDVVAASYGADLSRSWGRSVRRLVDEFGDRLGLRLASGNRGVAAWGLEGGGGMRTVGVGGGLSGHSGDVLVCDDPHKNREEAESRVMRDRVWDWWSSTFVTRRSPEAPIVLVLTRWHEDDLAGRLLREEGDLWRVVELPVFAREGDVLGRAVGEPLEHPKIVSGDRGELLRFWGDQRASLTARDWHSLYLCDPRPVVGAALDSEVVEAARWPVGVPVPLPVRAAVGVDPSGSRGGDVCGIVAAQIDGDGVAYLVGDYSGQMAATDWARRACLAALETGASIIAVEANYGGEMATGMIVSAWEGLVREGVVPDGVLMPLVTARWARRNKISRAESMGQQWKQARVKVVGGLRDLVDEWTRWSPSSRESPGRLDASVVVLMELFGSVPSGPVSVVEPPVGEALFGDGVVFDGDEDLGGYVPLW